MILPFQVIGFLHILLHLLSMTLPSVFWAVLPPMMLAAESWNLDFLPQKDPPMPSCFPPAGLSVLLTLLVSAPSPVDIRSWGCDPHLSCLFKLSSNRAHHLLADAWNTKHKTPWIVGKSTAEKEKLAEFKIPGVRALSIGWNSCSVPVRDFSIWIGAWVGNCANIPYQKVNWGICWIRENLASVLSPKRKVQILP